MKPLSVDELLESMQKVLGCKMTFERIPHLNRPGYFYDVRYKCHLCETRWFERVESGPVDDVFREIMAGADAHGVCDLKLGAAGRP